jgi:flagellar P-ring protein precursor FlgI
MAQGSVSIGGYDVRALGSRVSKNSATSGRVPSALILEKNMDATFVQNRKIIIMLRDPDFTAARNVAEAINAAGIGANIASAKDAGTIEVTLPATAAGITQEQTDIQNIARIEVLEVQTDPVGRVVINERTGTVVVGGNVRVLPTVIAHGGLEITIQKQVIVTQPAPFTIRPPRPVESAQVKVEEQQALSIPMTVAQTAGGAVPTVQDIANALNLLKVSPRDLIAIFQALKEAGTLQGELIIQ